MSTRERLTLAAALAVALGTAAVAPLYQDLLWLPRALLAIAAVAAVGLVSRRFSVPSVLQPVLAVAALLEVVALTFARSTMHLGLIPSGRTLPVLHALFQAGLDDVSELAPPVPTHEGLTLVAVLGIGAVAIVVDFLAVIAGRAALAGLPLLVLFAVPSAVRPGGVGWLPFTLGAAGWLALLLVEGSDRVGRWGTPLKAARPARAVYEDTSLGRVGRRIGAAALGIAVVVPGLLPGLDGRLVGGEGGDGSGGGSRTTTTYNPITRLRDQLRLPEPRLVLTYTTDDSAPDYLRMTTLDRFADAGWSASKLTGSPKRNGVDRGLPRPIGLTSTDTYEVHDQIRINTLDAQWLPTPFPAKKVDVDGQWLYDAASETVFGIRTGTQKLKKSYSVTATRLTPDRAVLDALSATGQPAQLQPYTKLPADLPRAVRTFTDRAIGTAETPYAKVAAIQHWFRDPANKFEYSTSTDVPGIDSSSALVDFLIQRKGFCEQYASAMAAMIRVAGIPARVAIGFTRGTRLKDDTYQVTTQDAHAWPEAWFAGAGWVRFEPTPRSDNQAVVPDYTLAAGAGAAAGGEQDPLAPKGDTADTASPQDALANKLDRLDPDPAPPAPVAQPTSSGSALPPLWLVGLALAAVLALLPSVLHVLRNRRRWATPGPLAAWRQVHDDAVDVGHEWRPQDSPRAAATHLAGVRSLDPPARQALERLALAAERARYARDGDVGDPTELRAYAELVRADLLAAAPTRVRWQARLAPTSTLRWASSATGTWVADQLDRFDDGWAAVRRRIVPGGARAV